MIRLMIAVLLIPLCGCANVPLVAIDKPVVPIVNVPSTENLEQTAGPQTAGDRGVNVGTVRIDGGTLALCVVGAVLLVALLARSRAGYKRAVQTLVRHNAETGITEDAKRAVQLRAYKDGSEKWLHRVVKDTSKK